MTSEKDKANRILKEVVGYFINHHLCDLDIHFHIDTYQFRLTVSTPAAKEPAGFQEMLRQLSTPREPELDEYFNSLLGSHGHKEDYRFLGKAIDEAVGGFNNGLLFLTLTRHNVDA